MPNGEETFVGNELFFPSVTREQIGRDKNVTYVGKSFSLRLIFLAGTYDCRPLASRSDSFYSERESFSILVRYAPTVTAVGPKQIYATEGDEVRKCSNLR